MRPDAAGEPPRAAAYCGRKDRSRCVGGHRKMYYFEADDKGLKKFVKTAAPGLVRVRSWDSDPTANNMWLTKNARKVRTSEAET